MEDFHAMVYGEQKYHGGRGESSLARVHLQTVDKMETHIEDCDYRITALIVDQEVLLNWGKDYRHD